MPRTKQTKDGTRPAYAIAGVGAGVVLLGLIYVAGFTNLFALEYDRADAAASSTANAIAQAVQAVAPKPQLDKDAYNAKLLALAHIDPALTTTPEAAAATAAAASSTASTTAPATTTPPAPKLTLIHPATASTTVSAVKGGWPVATDYPNVGALLPFNRIVAYYGNFYSTGMGVLGQYPPDQMLAMLASTSASWEAADPSTPVIPAIDYIAVTAQGSAGADGKYRARMPDSQLDKAVQLADQAHGIVILDVQVGLSTVETEVPLLEKYLSMPNVHLALDPEFDMHNGAPPGTVIGSMDAKDINWTANYLAGLVQKYNLPPKVLIVHRFTQNMVTNYQQVEPLPEVQIVMDMDGWGSPAKKTGTYVNVVAPQPIQFTGFKLFYKNDLKPPSTRMMTPAEVLALTPSPSFIQYQ
jgi:hypothetical protein